MIYDLKKEAMYGIRSGKLVSILGGFMFFSLLTPFMLKIVLPQVLLSRGASTQDLSGLLEISQIGCLQIYLKDMFEIGTIIVSFSLCGLLAQEIRDGTLVIPLCSGKKYTIILGSKVVVFGSAVLCISLMASIASYLYSGYLYSFEINVLPVLNSAFLLGIYMIFLVLSAAMWGSILKKPIATGFMTLLTAYGLHFLGELLDIHRWLPSGLLIQAQRLTSLSDASIFATIGITSILSIFMYVITLRRLFSLEWNER